MSNQQHIPTMTVVENVQISNQIGKKPGQNVALKTFRSILNVLTQMFIAITLFICLWYSCRSKKLNKFNLHIVLCVLGYQCFMCQGMLCLSQHNGWSMHIRRRYRRHLHWILQVIGVFFAAYGSIEMMKVQTNNFNTNHGIFGLCALLTGFLCSVLNGMITTSVGRLSPNIDVYKIKITHHITGLVTLVFATISLSLGYDYLSFRAWARDDAIVLILIAINWFTTIFVAIDFWIYIGVKISNCA